MAVRCEHKGKYMHQELSRREKVSTSWTVIWLLFAAVVLTGLNTVLFKLHWNSGITDLLIIVISVTGVYILIKRNLVSYKYSIIDDEFIVHEMIGSKEKIILNFNVAQIHKFAKTVDSSYDEDKQGDFVSKLRLYNSNNKPNRHYIIYDENSKSRWFTFQPSDHMVELIEEKMKHSTQD